jgi:anti-sigma-K factor RskA
VESYHPQVDLAGAYVLGALDPGERTEFEAHVALCAICAAEVRSLSPVVHALAQVVAPDDPSPAVRARLMSRVRPRVVLAPWLAAAAGIVVAAGLGLYATRLQGRVGTLEGQLRQAILRADSSERLVADANRTTAHLQNTVAVLAAPDLARVDLAGQPAAPRASGRAFWSRSRGLVFTASGLPPLPAGRTYQLWVLTAQPAPISAGLLKPDTGGRFSDVFDTPLDLPQPTAMAVTIEPEGGVPAPTGDKYLVGLAH